MTLTNPSNLCVFCGSDCEHRPRYRNARGACICKPCHDRRHPPIAPSPSPSDDEAPIICHPARPCPNCHRILEPDALLCVNCGYQHDTRRFVKTLVGNQTYCPICGPDDTGLSTLFCPSCRVADRQKVARAYEASERKSRINAITFTGAFLFTTTLIKLALFGIESAALYLGFFVASYILQCVLLASAMITVWDADLLAGRTFIRLAAVTTGFDLVALLIQATLDFDYAESVRDELFPAAFSLLLGAFADTHSRDQKPLMAIFLLARLVAMVILWIVLREFFPFLKGLTFPTPWFGIAPEPN